MEVGNFAVGEFFDMAVDCLGTDRKERPLEWNCWSSMMLEDHGLVSAEAADSESEYIADTVDLEAVEERHFVPSSLTQTVRSWPYWMFVVVAENSKLGVVELATGHELS